jgi:glycerate-2-kinase
MIIKNKDLLSDNPIRERALEIIEAGLASIDTKKVIQETVKVKGDFLFVKGQTYELTKFRHIYLVAFGKDAFSASVELGKILGDRLTSGVVLSLKSAAIPKMETFQCTHPKPSLNNVVATKKAVELIKKTTEDDLVLLVISGGGSAMLTAPFKITYEEKALIAEQLMNSGANIEELNIVRKHLSEVKGGRLAQLAYPSTLVTLIFSDVIGNNLSTIASGPTVIDHTSVEDAEKVLNKYNILEKVAMPDLALNESPKDQKFFARVNNFLIVDNSIATAAMEDKARALGYSTRILANNISGNAHELGAMLLKECRKGEALIAAGETTIEVFGDGVGGRCQEMALANLDNVKENQVLICIGSDGHDHSDFAGAVCDTYTVKRAKEEKLNPKDYLTNNDSFNFFRKVGEGIDTGFLESNVADLMLVLRDK